MRGRLGLLVALGALLLSVAATAQQGPAADEARRLEAFRDQVNAGSYIVTATYAGDANHTCSSYWATITIGKASSTTTTIGAERAALGA